MQIKPVNPEFEKIASVEFKPMGSSPIFCLELFETNKPSNRTAMRNYLGYELWQVDSPREYNLLFAGEGFLPSPLHADDSKQTIEAIMNFLCLREGDTDSEYFLDYTREQMEFSQQFAEALHLSVLDWSASSAEKTYLNLGDANPLEHEGYFVELDTLRKQAHYLSVEEGSRNWKLYSFDIDRLTSAKITNEWFFSQLQEVASFVGQTRSDLVDSFCNPSAIIRAQAYRALADYFGYHELDSCPVDFNGLKEEAILKERFLGEPSVEILEYMVCSDCYHFHHGNDLDCDQDREAEIAACFQGEQEEANGYFSDYTYSDSETDSGIEEFSWSPCEVCRSPLGGCRYRLAIVKNEGIQ